MGLIIAVYIQWQTYGSFALEESANAFFNMLSICVLNVSMLSSVIPSSLTSLLSSIVSPQTSVGAGTIYCSNSM